MSEDIRVRVSVYMDKDLAEYMSMQSKKMGISKSGYINMVVSNDKMQKDVLSMTNGFQDIVNTLNEMKKNGK